VTEAHADLSGPGRHDQQAGDGGNGPGQRGNKWWTLVAVCLGTFMLLLDITIVNVALPDIQRALHSSFSDLQWVVDAYALTLAAFLLTAGSLADMYGRRLLYMIGLAAFTTGLNRILLVAAIIAFVSGVVSLAAIRSRDFAPRQ
jgi:MFS family permease